MKAAHQTTSASQLHIRQIGQHLGVGAVALQAGHHLGQGLGPHLGQVALKGRVHGKGQLLVRRVELGLHAGLVAPRIDPEPAMPWQPHRIEPMQAIGHALPLNRQALVAQPRGNALRPEQRRQQVAFGIAIARAMQQHIRRLARDRVALEISTVLDLVAHKVEGARNGLVGALRTLGQLAGLGRHGRVLVVNEFAGFQVGVHKARRHSIFVHGLHVDVETKINLRGRLASLNAPVFWRVLSQIDEHIRRLDTEG
jgi:hypothetical protein